MAPSWARRADRTSVRRRGPQTGPRYVPFILAAVLWLGAPVAAQRPKVSLKDIVDAAAAYLVDYQKQFAFVLADEEYTQLVLESPEPGPRVRITTGESFLTFSNGEHSWITVRDVAAVDGVPVPDREDLRALLQRGIPRMEQRIVERNSRYNIGSIERNINEPTIGLHALERLRDDEFKFDVERIDLDGDMTIVTLSFKEKGPMTLVHGSDHRPLYSTGEVVVEAETGRIRRTSLDLKYGPVVAQLTTDYGKVPALDMWVPLRFQERYEQKRNGGRELIVCVARYTNYRRFEVNVRIR